MIKFRHLIYFLSCSTIYHLPSTLCFSQHYMALPSTSTRFLLLDRPDPNKIFKDIEESTPTLKHFPLTDYSQEMWNKAREAVESGKIREQLPVTEEIIIPTEIPSPPPGEIEFKESQTTLSLTGRKVIGFNYSGKSYINEQKTIIRPKSSSAFEINQQLQVRMQGKVGEKITVNVDYDDTKQDKQDISVVYQGDPEEVVQNVSFGDIDLSLPATEFVSYNKQLFGIRTDLKAKNAKFTIVGSRTKGQTRVRRFTGNTQFQGVDILDSQYLRRQYYDITFGNTARLPIKQGSEKIYIDRQTQQVVDNITIFEKTGDDLAVQSSSYTGKFQFLNPGIDYVMDYAKGIVMFTRSLNPQDVVIIDFENANGTKLSQNPSTASLLTGGTGNYKIIKTVNDIYISSTTADLEVGYKRELKTYYSIGQTNIVRDDGRGNFVLKVQDFNRQEVGSSLTPVQKYPDTIHVDFEQGRFYLDHVFTVPGSTEPDPQIYSPSPIAKRIIRVEYYYRFKTFMLEPNIVVQSEIVRIDGNEKKRHQDYFIDYDSGFITFYYPETIRQDSVIEITYEVSPFGGLGNVSLLGARASYDLGSHISLGSSLLYQGGFKPNTVPSVSDLTNSITVVEGDMQLKNLNLLGIKSNFNVEAAQSINNPNLFDYALIDNMEGITQEDSLSMDHNFWYIASNPTEGPSDPDAIEWKTEKIKATDINSQAGSEDTQQVLSINYDFSISTEVSIVYPFSSGGLDFSQKNVLELVLYGNYSSSNPGPQINIHLGQINEDVDGSGGQSFKCASGISLTGAPKSEDINCDGQLGTNEDIGWEYKFGNKSKRFGAGNGRIDTTDLDKNGRLDPESPLLGGSFGYRYNQDFIDKNDNNIQKSTINFSGWHTWYVPLNISSTDTYKWSAIKQVRISLKKSPGGATSGIVKFARISVIGNSWYVQQSTTPGKLDVLSVNNINTPEYIPIYNASQQEARQVFEDLYGSVSEQKRRTDSITLTEQSLAINYTNIDSNSTAYVYKKFLRPIDISQHEKFRFLLYSTATSNAYFYLKVGDENNYHQAEIPLNFTGWRLYTIEQKDVTKDGIPEEWQDKSNPSYGVILSSKGSPNLQQVSIIMAQILAKDLNQYSGIVYLNEIHLDKSKERKGQALKAEGSFEIPRWFSFGGKHRKVDRNFQTPVTVITNQENEQNSAYLNISRISFFPMSFNASKQITETPNTYLTGTHNLVTSLQGGTVKRFDGTATGNINIRHLPNIGLNYVTNKTEYILAKREDNKNTYSGNFNYNVPIKFFIVPRTVNANYSLSISDVDYEKTSFNIAQNFANTRETGNNYGIKLSFVPWSGSTFNPGYSYQEVREKRTELATLNISTYPKSAQQTVELNSNFRFFSWFNPGINYSISTIENNNLNITTVTVAQSSAVFNVGDIKTITRNSQGSLGLNINMNELMPKNKLLRSMMVTSNYQIQDGDTWQNIEKEFDSRKYLWIRDSIKPAQKLAQRTNLTKRDTISSNQRWQPFVGYAFKGRYSPFSTLSIMNNFSNSVQRSETTGTRSKTINRTFPDMVLSFSHVEILTHTEKWAQSATLNFKFSKNSNENVNISLETSKNYGLDLRFRLLNFMDTAMSYNLRLSDKTNLRLNLLEQESKHNDVTLQGTFGIKKFTFTPKIGYSSDLTETGLGVKTQDLTTITPSILARTDLQAPKGLKLPFIKKTPVTLTNRIIWTTTLSYAIKKSPITIAENSRLLSFNTSADYEAMTNLRITINAAVKRLWHTKLKQEEYLEYQAGSTLVFQF